MPATVAGADGDEPVFVLETGPNGAAAPAGPGNSTEIPMTHCGTYLLRLTSGLT